jgi:hypothetical protein
VPAAASKAASEDATRQRFARARLLVVDDSISHRKVRTREGAALQAHAWHATGAQPPRVSLNHL